MSFKSILYALLYNFRSNIAGMPRKKDHQTDERNQALMKKYEDVLNELRDKYGPLADDISMRRKYTMVAEGFYISWRTAAAIIAQMTKKQCK